MLLTTSKGRGRRTVDAERVDGVDELLVHLDGPHDARLLRIPALPVAVAAARPLQAHSDTGSSRQLIGARPWTTLDVAQFLSTISR